MSSSHESRERIQAVLRGASADAQKVAGEVLRLERDKLHMKNPRGINEDLADIVKAVVK